MVHSSTWLGHAWVYEDFCCSHVCQQESQSDGCCTAADSGEKSIGKNKRGSGRRGRGGCQLHDIGAWEDKAERRNYYREGTHELSSETKRKVAVEAVLLRLPPLSNCGSEGLSDARCTGSWLLDGYSQLQTSNDVLIDWSVVPAAADPARGSNFKAPPTRQEADSIGVRMGRGERKRWQVTSMAAVLRSLELPDGAVVADFGSGSGALCLPLAALFPHLRFVGIDWKPRSIHLLCSRAQEAGLKNVRGWCGRIENFPESFDACVALHACGSATDFAQIQAMARRAAYIFSPCCVGKLQKGIARQADDTWHVESGREEGHERCEAVPPRSTWLRAHCSSTEMALIAQTADWSCYDHDSTPSFVHVMCKALVETDRNEAARERGYNTHLMRLLHPQSGVVGTGDILVGTVGVDRLAPHVRPLPQWGAGSSPFALSWQLGAQH